MSQCCFAVHFAMGLVTPGVGAICYGQPFVSIAGTPGSRGHNEYIDGANVSYTNYSAELGEGTEAIIVNTRSGSNQYHGSLCDYEQNSSFDARNFFAAAVSRNHYHNSEGTFGGPIFKNKIFFCGSGSDSEAS